MFDFIDETSVFWFYILTPDNISKILVPEGVTCMLTNIACDQEQIFDREGHVKLYATVNDGSECLIGSFILNIYESSNVRFVFREGDVIKFRVDSNNVPVHISGYIIDGHFLEFSKEEPESAQ